VVLVRDRTASPTGRTAGRRQSVKAFEVYHVGETEADIARGQDFPKLWATWPTTGRHLAR
jgi:hypothetical protein